MKKSFLTIILIVLNFGIYAQNKPNAKQPIKSKPSPTTNKTPIKPPTSTKAKSTQENKIEEIIIQPNQQVGNATLVKTEPYKKYNYDSSDLVVRWHELIFDLIEQTIGYTPNVAARNMAYINLASYEAVLPAFPDNVSLSGQLQAFQKPDSLTIDSTNFNASLAASSAIFTMVDKLFISSPFIWMEKVYALKDSINNYYQTRVSEETMMKSKRHGEKIAKWVYEYSKNDGGNQAYMRTYDMNYKLLKCLSCFEINRVADLENTGPLHPNWGKNRTFIKENQSDVNIKPKIEFSIYRGSPFYKMALEVYTVSKEVVMNSEKLQIANFWDDASTYTYSAPGHSISILTQVLKQNPVAINRATELYSNLAMAISDALIVTWRIKYQYNLIRPITYIKRYIDSKWEAALLTPPFPEFPSGHSAQSATMATILTSKIGDSTSFTDYSKYFVGPPKTFASFWTAANECSISRVYGGIHYRDGIEQGAEVGKIVGKNSLNLRYTK